MLARVVLSIVVGILVFLACKLLGGLAAAVAISWVAAIGSFFVSWAALIGLLAAVWYFFSGSSWPIRRSS